MGGLRKRYRDKVAVDDGIRERCQRFQPGYQGRIADVEVWQAAADDWTVPGNAAAEQVHQRSAERIRLRPQRLIFV